MPLKLNSSGGGSVTLDTPSTASTFTLTVPAITGTAVVTGSSATVSQGMLAAGVAGNGPAFSAYASGVTNTPNATFTKIVLASEEFDTASCFDTSLSRFTPNVAGYYFVCGGVSAGYATQITTIYKNGSEYKRGVQVSSAGAYLSGTTASALVYMNGSTDYVELYWYQASGSTVNSSAVQASTYFQGFLARAA
jgi:hypothetical protein